MQYKIINNPMGMLVINMNKDEEITAEAGSLVYLKGDIEIKTRMRNKGLLKSLKVTVLGGETFFVNDYIAHEDNSILGLTGPPVGDICQIKV
ncbi:MAG: AIM24 family protein, partial [Candidatus Nitrosocaldaceae archaeon]